MSTKKFSDFTEGPVQEGDHKFSDIEIVWRSHINVMTKARRNGQIWMLKSLTEDVADDLLYQEMLYKECRLLMQVQGHKSIVRCTGMENVEGLGDAIVMEYVEGKNLAEMITQGNALTTQERLRIFRELLDAVEYLHQSGCVHCDLKPENIMLTHVGKNVKLIDFGFTDSDSYYILKQASGTHGYMPPDRESGKTPDARTDIYALGKILEDLGLGDAYAEVIARCQKPAAQRYSTVSELRTDLDASVRKYHKRQRIHKMLKWLGGIALAICLLLAVFYGISLFRSRNVIHKGDTFKTALDFLRPFGINETETPWGNVLEGRKQLLLWGPEYKNARWHNSGDATQMYPTITEQWGPEGAEPELIHTRNKEHHWMYSRLDELRLTFMKNFVDTGYVFLGVYRMSLTQSDTTKVVWVRVAEEVDIDDLDAVEALRNEPRD